MRGSKPKPTKLKDLEGNPGKRPLNKNEPQPTVGTSPPDFLDARAQREWYRVYAELGEAGIITELDRGTLTIMCQMWSQFEEMTELIQRDGFVFESENRKGYMTYRRHPNVDVRDKAIEKYLRCAAELGCTPSARTRLSVVKKDEKKDEDLFQPTGKTIHSVETIIQ